MATPTQPKPLPFYCQFTAGAIAGVTELLLLYPLDTVKTRLMLQGKKAAAGADHYNGMVDAFRKIVKAEGVGRLYRGLVPPLMLEAPKRAVKFAANDFWGKTYRDLTGTAKQTQALSVLTGMSAGATESVVVVPFELVKIRLQDKAQAHLYSGPIDVVKKIVARDGVRGMYAGFESTLWRHVIWNGFFFSTVHALRARISPAKTKSEQLGKDFFCGSVGGFCGTFFNTPVDVFKSRVQNTQYGPGQRPLWTFQGVAKIASDEGLSALYKGFTPKVLRLAPGGGVLLLVVEVVLGQFRTFLGPPYI